MQAHFYAKEYTDVYRVNLGRIIARASRSHSTNRRRTTLIGRCSTWCPYLRRSCADIGLQKASGQERDQEGGLEDADEDGGEATTAIGVTVTSPSIRPMLAITGASVPGYILLAP